MDSGSRIGGGSGIPKPSASRLPQLRSNRASVVLDPAAVSASLAEHAAASTSTDQNGTTARPAMKSPSKIAGPFSPPQNKRRSLLLRPGFQTSGAVGQGEEEESIAGLMSPPPRKVSQSTEAPVPEERALGSPPLRKPRPSLSDRTVETLSQVPPSPTPSKRRQSGFYAADSPMRPPSRAMSALGHSRPGSQLGSYGTVRGDRPGSPTKRGALHDRSQSTSVAGQRVASSETPGSNRVMPASSSGQAGRPQQAPGGIPKLSSTTRMPLGGSKTLAARPTQPKSPLKSMFEPVGLRKSTTAPPGTAKSGAPSGLRKAPSIAHRGSGALQKPRTFKTNQSLDDERVEDDRPTKSSQALRDAIRQAKAAKRDSSSTNGSRFVPRSAEQEQIGLGIETDPLSLDLLDSSHVNILRKRVNNAKEDGKLNIAALCLNELPIEVLKMYDPEAAGEGGPAWYESVDVKRLNAADNELGELPEEVFPQGSSPRRANFDLDEQPATAIFAGLEAIDLHGNQLKTVPLSLGRLPQLTSLNISGNQLGADSLDIISRVLSLRELRLAENSFKGALPDSIGNMENLEVLDLHRNAITNISTSLGKLSKLRRVNVSSNQLSSLPMEAIFDLPIVEIDASRNRLNGSLLPPNIPQVPFLQTLDISCNALLMLSEIKVDFPALQSLNIANNRIAVLQDISSWQHLTMLNADENKISEIPAGLTSLKRLTHADFGNNSLLQLEDAIGSMDNLTTLNIHNNPLRERRLLRLQTEELKTELRSRIDLLSPKSDRSASISNFGGITRSTSWAASGDTIDRSNARLKTIDKADLEPIAGENIRTLILHHNQLVDIPVSLEMLGATITTLDLSNNKLGKNPTFLPTPLTLPNLQSLNLTSNALTSLTPLVESLTAPKLATLILLFNRLTSLPTSPSLTAAFPSLSKLLASNNKICILDVESISGLQVLDVSSNEIEALPPRLALLEGTLRTLIVNGNKFRVPGWGVLEKGTEEILKWCRRKIPAGEEGAIED